MKVTDNIVRQMGFDKRADGRFEIYIHGYRFVLYPDNELKNDWRFVWGKDLYEHLITDIEEMLPMIVGDMESNE